MPESVTPTLATEMQHRLNALTAWVVVGLGFILVFALTVMLILMWLVFSTANTSRDVRTTATESHVALCALKSDVRSRHASGLAYQKAHPEGLVRTDGVVLISPAQLRQSLESQRATLAALATLDCKR
jgi:hypothetical protein